MGPFAELLASGHLQTLEFFVAGLRDVSEHPLDQQELFYNASVLAHYAETSTSTSDGWPAPTTLSTVFDQFVFQTGVGIDGPMMETAAAQCLLLSGFFEDQSKRRHNIHWYSQLGAGFFARAARGEGETPKAQLLRTLSLQFEPWRQRHARLGRELRDQQYLLTIPSRTDGRPA